MDREAWQARIHRVAQSDMTEATWHAVNKQYVCVCIRI